MCGYDEPAFPIGVVSKILGIHPQTLRQYEREGLITPQRTSGKVRLYSQADIDGIKLILQLTRELGVNLAGVDIILRMKTKLDQFEYENDNLRAELANVNQNGMVPPNKSVVTKRSSYEVVIFDKM